MGVREPWGGGGGRQCFRRGGIVGRQVGDPRRRQGTGEVGGRIWWCVVRSRWQKSHKVKAAGVEVGGTPGTHHQDLFGIVVQGGDTCSHADGEAKPGHTVGGRGGETETASQTFHNVLFFHK